MIFYNYDNSNAEVVGGVFEDNTLRLRGILKQIFIKATTASTIFDVQLTDKDDDIVLERTAETGTLNESIDFAMRGIYTIKILNSTVDETFIVKLLVREI